MAMAVPDLSFTCCECGVAGRGPRVTQPDRRIVCVECYTMSSMDPLTRHFCPDWDGMAIDKNSGEYECCECVKNDP